MFTLDTGIQANLRQRFQVHRFSRIWPDGWPGQEIGSDQFLRLLSYWSCRPRSACILASEWNLLVVQLHTVSERPMTKTLVNTENITSDTVHYIRDPRWGILRLIKDIKNPRHRLCILPTPAWGPLRPTPPRTLHPVHPIPQPPHQQWSLLYTRNCTTPQPLKSWTQRSLMDAKESWLRSLPHNLVSVWSEIHTLKATTVTNYYFYSHAWPVQ